MASFQQITEEGIRNQIPMRKAINLMKEAFRLLSSGGAVAPVRTVIDSEDHLGRALFMPSYSSAYSLFGLKMVSVFDRNATKNLPAIQGKMLVMDGTTGTPLASLDAAYLTALRTGAASGLATEVLSQPDSKVLAVFGSGAQAETQLEGILCVRPVTEVIVYGVTESKTISFCEHMYQKFGTHVHPALSEDLLRADIICCATTSATPVFLHAHLKKGVHINGIGSFTSTMREIPTETIKQSLLVVDHREAALTEAGDIVIPIQQGAITANHIHAELGEIISGSKKGRTSNDQITVFKSVGNAVQDLAIAHCMIEMVSGIR